VQSQAMGHHVGRGFSDWKEGRLDLYDVKGFDPISGDPVMHRISENSLNGKSADIFLNGIRNDAERAAILGADKVGKNAFTLAHNPTYSILADTVETGLGKLTGHSSTGNHLAEILLRLDSKNSSLYLHSQGAQIGMNGLQAVHRMGRSVGGLAVRGYGGATNILTSRLIVNSVRATWSGWTINPFDAVPNIVGLNALYAPHRFITSTLASPLLFASARLSPHTMQYGSIWSNFNVTY
jgi:hypothetical protein